MGYKFGLVKVSFELIREFGHRNQLDVTFMPNDTEEECAHMEWLLAKLQAELDREIAAAGPLLRQYEFPFL